MSSWISRIKTLVQQHYCKRVILNSDVSDTSNRHILLQDVLLELYARQVLKLPAENHFNSNDVASALVHHGFCLLQYDQVCLLL